MQAITQNAQPKNQNAQHTIDTNKNLKKNKTLSDEILFFLPLGQNYRYG